MEMKDQSYLSFSLCISLLHSNRVHHCIFHAYNYSSQNFNCKCLFQVSDVSTFILVVNKCINYCINALQNNSCATYLNITNHDLISYVNLSLFLPFLLPLQPQHQNLVLLVVQKFFLDAA